MPFFGIGAFRKNAGNMREAIGRRLGRGLGKFSPFRKKMDNVGGGIEEGGEESHGLRGRFNKMFNKRFGQKEGPQPTKPLQEPGKEGMSK